MAGESSSLDIAQDNINIESEIISIDPKYHGYFFANRRMLLNRITEECRGVQILFPRASINSDIIVIKGPDSECIKAAKKRMLQSIQDLESLVTILCKIPRRHRRVVMGPKGSNIQNITAEFDVRIKFPDRFEYAEEGSDKQDNDEAGDVICDLVRITGKQGNLEAAKDALLSLVPVTIQVYVPHDFHPLIIGERGCDVKQLREKYGVTIILSRAGEKLDYVGITGLSPDVEKAKKAILEKCKTLEHERQERALRSYEVKIKVDSEYHPEIIGRADGAVIRKIISDNDVAINFPSIGDTEDNIITITGYKKNVLDARDDIMRIVDELVPLKRSQDLSNIHREFTDAEDHIKIEGSIEQAEKVQAEMQKLHENFNVSHDSISMTQQHTVATTDNVILKQEKEIAELRKHLDDQVSRNKALKADRARLILEIDSERQESERIVCAQKNRFKDEAKGLSDTINDMKAKLNSEQEEKLRLLTESNESSKRFKDLLSKYKALQVTCTEHERQIECSESRIKELKEKVSSLNDQLDEFGHIHCGVDLSGIVKLAEYREQLQNSTLMHSMLTSKLSEVVANNKELLNTVARTVDDMDRLKTMSQSKDEKISKLNIDLSNALESNRDLSEIIQSLNTELFIKEEELCQAQMDLNTYRTNMDEQREVE